MAWAILAPVLSAASFRFNDEADRRAFRAWFAFLAESQFFCPTAQLPPEIHDCAALVRFAYREALREHSGAWATGMGLGMVPPMPSPRLRPSGANLFRIDEGRWAQFADADTLRRYNTRFLTRDIRRAERGDLLFYRQLDQASPYHVMVFLGPSQLESGARKFVVYHTGPIGGSAGEIRRPTVEELLHHPLPKWRPLEGNPNFLGVHRWRLLGDLE
jgi:uncharacterized protein